MRNITTTQQLTEKFELLGPLQQQTVYEFITFLISQHRVQDVSEQKHLLLQTSVWTAQDIQRIYDVQQEMKTWHIPTLS